MTRSEPSRQAVPKAPTIGVDPFAFDLDQALEASWLRRSMSPAVFSLVAAIVDRLFAEDAATPEGTP